jgi:hypothetical protein
VHLKNVGSVLATIAAAMIALTFYLWPAASGLMVDAGEWLRELPERMLAPPRKCAKDASGIVARIVDYGEKNSLEEFNDAFRGSLWGQSWCAVAEVKMLPEPKSEGGFRAMLVTITTIYGTRIPVMLQAHMQVLPRKPLQKGTFVALSGVLRHIETKAVRTPDVHLVVHLHDSAFPERWLEVVDPGIQPKAVKN